SKCSPAPCPGPRCTSPKRASSSFARPANSPTRSRMVLRPCCPRTPSSSETATRCSRHKPVEPLRVFPAVSTLPVGLPGVELEQLALDAVEIVETRQLAQVAGFPP